MLYGATLSTTATWVGVGIIAGVAVYDLGQNMVDWSARSRASGDWITAPAGYVASAAEIKWLRAHGAEPAAQYLPKK
jgi:phosphate/sulfate permease